MMNMNETQQETAPERPANPESRPYGHHETAWHRKPAYPEDPRFKSTALATFLSMVPGLGQIYVGYYRQGFINILVIGSLISLISQGHDQYAGLLPLMVFFLVFYWLFNLVDAARRASFYNQALMGITVTDMPREFTMPEKYGSPLVGAMLIVAGLVIGSHTLFGYSLAWIERWWPLALVVVGGYLVYQSVLDRRR